MTSIFYLILGFALISLILSILKPQSKGSRYKNTNDNQHIFTDQMMFNNVNDLNGNGVPDNIENGSIDSDHDGIPDYMDSNPGIFDENSNDFGSYNDSNDGFNTESYDSGSSFDLGNSADSSNFDSSSFDSGSFDSGSSGMDSSSGGSF
jgi:hypothetical protein